MEQAEVTGVGTAQRAEFEREGFTILERFLSSGDLDALRSECARFIEIKDREMASRGKSVEGINHKGKRYFISNRHPESEVMTRFLFGPRMARVAQALLGDEVYLFNEQWVVKCAEVGMSFAWHQDSGYVGHEHRPYLSIWCALDDMTEKNGTIFVLPYPRAGTRKRIEHQRQDGTNDLVGYRGEDQGVPVVVPAGSIVCFSSTLLHRSGANETGGTRRVYLAQYSAEPILTADGSRLWALAAPVVQGGKLVRPG